MNAVDKLKTYLELAEKAKAKETAHEMPPAYLEFLLVSRTMGPALAKALLTAVEYIERQKEEGWYTESDGVLDDIEKILGESK